MCGITVYWQEDGLASSDRAILEKMTNELQHRGPDHQGIHFNSPIGLGARRLSIIDLPGGNQPIHNERKTLWLVFNGEIYNYQALRRKLLDLEHEFYTKSDSEVIVHLFEEYGPRCVDQMDGMFAFAIWDEVRQSLFAARDRMGMKPLYYWFDGKRFLIASELKAIIAHPLVSREIDPQGVYEILRFRLVAPPRTIFREIGKLAAGHCLTLEEGQLTVSQYWDVPLAENGQGPTRRDEGTLCEQIREGLEDAVSSHLVSDVPLGALLSGGIDSSAVVAIMARHMDQPVKTFSVGFDSASPGIDERDYARLIARMFKTEHHELVMKPSSMELFRELAWYLDEPIGDPAILPTYAVSRFAREHVKVCLTGDGGDELFAGYGKYRTAWWAHRYGNLHPIGASLVKELVSRTPGAPSGMKEVIRLEESTQLEEMVTHLGFAETVNWGRRLMNSTVVAEIEQSGGALAWFPGLLAHVQDHSLVDKMLYLDAKTVLPELFLMKSDKMSMANSLELRSPFLDHHFVETISSIPGTIRASRGRTKHLLKRALKDLLPDEISYRRKHYFSVPLRDWLTPEAVDEGAPLIEERLGQNGIFDIRGVKGVVSACRSGKTDYVPTYFRLLMFALWSERFGVHM